jgi:hypothetical protein
MVQIKPVVARERERLGEREKECERERPHARSGTVRKIVA